MKTVHSENLRKAFQVAGIILAMLILCIATFSNIDSIIENSYLLSTKSNPSKVINFNLFTLYIIGIVGFYFGMFLVYLFNFIFNKKNLTSLWFALFLFFIAIMFILEIMLKLGGSKIALLLLFFSADFAKIAFLIIILRITNMTMLLIDKYIIGLLFLSWVVLVISMFFNFQSFSYPLHAFCTLILYFQIFKSTFAAYKKSSIGTTAFVIVLIMIVLAILMIVPSENLILIKISNLKILGNTLFPLILAIFISYLFAKDYSNLLHRQEEVKMLIEEKNSILEKQNETLALQVAEKTAELQAINSSKDKLFSIIAHDLRSPIASIKGVLELLDNQQLTQDEFLELSKYLKNNVDNVHGMLENLLQWSLSQMKGIKPKLQQFDINLIIDETINFFEEVANQKQIDLKNNINQGIFAYADQHQIQTVLRNLVNNAIKFTHQFGCVAVSGHIRDNFVVLKISDSGTGIKQEDLPTIFTKPKLKRGTSGEKGTGLGLILCKDLIEQNGGKIAVLSEHEKGTTFEVFLPTA